MEADRPEAESKQKSMMSPMTIRLIVLLIVGVLASALPGVSGAPGAAGQFEGMSVLIDASKGGGIWWAPQAPPGLDPERPHQGSLLADYLRSLGFEVTELPRTATFGNEVTISLAQLREHDLVIRAPEFFEYTAAELAAYDVYVAEGGNLFIVADHLSQRGRTDDLAEHFGVTLAGVTDGVLDTFAPSPLTEGVGPLAWRVGSGIVSHTESVTIVGWLSEQSFVDLDGDDLLDPGEPTAPPVLAYGIHGQGRVVVLAEMNSLQGVPQPLTDNIINWLARPPLACYALTTTVDGGLGAAPTLSPPNCPGGKYEEGSVVEVEADPAAGWVVLHWAGSDNDLSGDPRNTVTVTGNAELRVRYRTVPLLPGQPDPRPFKALMPMLASDR